MYWVLQPGSDIGGIGMGLVRMVRPWDEWLVVWGYDISGPPPEVDDDTATRIVHDLVGDDSVQVTIRSISLWGNNKMYATRYRSGRVVCMDDAVHRHPPSNGLGSNTSGRTPTTSPAGDLAGMPVLLALPAQDEWVARPDAERTADVLRAAGAAVVLEVSDEPEHVVTDAAVASASC